MRERIIDTALIVTLIIVAFGITWTLLTLNRGDDRQRVREPGTTEASEPDARGGMAITPLPLEGDSAGEQDQPPVIGGPIGGPSTVGTEAEAGETEVEEAEPQARAPEVEPVPPGVVRLERVGFSFVTGGAGACGVILEPWRHVAVSRELLAAYGCGAEVTITLDEEKGGRNEFQAVVADTMNPVHSRTVNIYVGEDEPALEYGVTSGRLDPEE